jgi:predicted metal-dependent hydrolase
MDVIKQAFIERFIRNKAQSLGVPVPTIEYRSKKTNYANIRINHTTLNSRIIINSNFVEKQSYSDMEQLCLHELMHIIALGDHHGQKFVEACAVNGCKRDKRGWNYGDP